MKTKTIVGSALASVLSLGAMAAVAAEEPGGPAPAPKFEVEKGYGIVKAGKNDCQTATGSCAGTAAEDGQPDAWVYLPKGTCGKIVGCSTEPKG